MRNCKECEWREIYEEVPTFAVTEKGERNDETYNQGVSPKNFVYS